MEYLDKEITNANLIMGVILEHARLEKRVSDIERVIDLIILSLDEDED